MLKNKLILATAIITMASAPVIAQDLTLSDLTNPQPPAYRVGISEIPERQYIEALEEKNKVEQKYANIDNSQDGNLADLTYADLSIKRLSKEISQELEYEEQEMVADLSLLWQGAAMQSDTINFALYKLANPDADKPNEKSIKKVLTTIASMSTLVGAGIGNPVLAGSSLIGGNILGIMGQDTKALNYKYTRVNDADMIILIRKVEDLQQKAVDLYYDYMSSKKHLEFMNDLVKDRQRKFELAQQNNASRELIVITDAYYRTALDKQRTAKSDFFSKRAALEQFVGNETFIQFEQELLARENGETKAEEKETKINPISEEEQQEYNNTIQNVENYTNNLTSTHPLATESSEPDYKVELKPEFIGPKYLPIQGKATQVHLEENYAHQYKAPEHLKPELSNVKLPEEGSFYSEFETGYAIPVDLDEFFQPETYKKEKPAKEKQIKEQKPKKEKVKKSKTEDSTISTEEEEEEEKQTSSEIIVPKVKQPKEKKIKQKKEKPAKIENENNQGVGIEWLNGSYKDIPEQTTEAEKEVSSVSADKKVKKQKNEKEKKIKEKKEKVKKERDLYPELHGQKPLHKYPRNSTKDLIFLHGKDKNSIKNIEKTDSQQNTTTQGSAYNIPTNIKPDDFLPLDNTIHSRPAQVTQPANDYGLMPLDSIKIPELTKGGYSIHSEYGE